VGAHLFGCEGRTNGSHSDSSDSSNREFLLFGEEAVALDVLLQVKAVEEPARQRRVETQTTTNKQTTKRTDGLTPISAEYKQRNKGTKKQTLNRPNKQTEMNRYRAVGLPF
jgi:hypothetical protein